ncbi:hypothetical protein, conserved [Eimeria brunetti]|uniref:Uncharacterized protein n=1 Tax=Eimeria brunetti TaxID=51314 RepID=U6LFL1_9EIME|nr:hypothetical protein, conserved [Eimeria brunetti]
MNERSDERPLPSGVAVAAAAAAPVAEGVGVAAAAGKQQLVPAAAASWDSTPDAAASTCVSGSEGSLPPSNQQQHEQQQQQQQQQKLQREGQAPVHCTDARPERLTAPGAADAAAPHSEQQQQQQQHQQQLLLHHPNSISLHSSSVKRSQGNKSDGGEGCGAPSARLSSDQVSSVAAQQLQRGSSSSCCSSTSIGGELRGLINALASVDAAAGSGELQQLLQQLLAERDLYKAAFGAAKEELKDLECRQQQLTQALQQAEHERQQERMQQQLAAAAAADRPAGEAGGPQDMALHWNGSSSSSSNNNGAVQQQLADSNGNAASSTCSSAEGPYNWLQQLHACVAAGTYPRLELLQKSVEQQQQLIRLAEGLQQERESYVEAVACLHSQLREAREDVSLYMSAHATHAADLTAESDEAIRAADIWLLHALRVGARCKLWGMGSVLHCQEAAAAAAAAAAKPPTLSRACSTATQADAFAAAAAASVAAAAEPVPGVSVALAAAASVYCVQDTESVEDEGTHVVGAAGAAAAAAAAADFERLWWGHAGDAFAERQQLLQHNKQRQRNNRLLWFLE